MPPEINAPKFSIITKAMTGNMDGDRRRFSATASSTITDRAGDEISLKALQQMAEKFRQGVTIFTDHENKVANAFGTTDTAEIVQRGQDRTGTAIWDLDIGGVVNEPNANAVQLHDSIKGGYVKLGCSIDAFVLDHERKKSGGLSIDGLDVYAASIVGVPMNQRSWTQKALRAIKSFHGEPEEEDMPPEITKGDLSAEARDNLDDSEFACPEKRKYPINDAAHVRAALSRIADPSNDQCGRDKIIAAARKMGIGEHGKSLDDAGLILWASKALTPDLIASAEDDSDVILVEKELEPEVTTDIPVTDSEAEEPAETETPEITEKAAACPTCGMAKDMGGDCSDHYHSQMEKSIEPAVNAGGQESPVETPETAPEDPSADADPLATEKALVFETTDVVELARHAATLAIALDERDTKIAELTTERDRLASENEEAKQVIEKMMAMPLRRKAVGVAADFSDRLPDFLAPEVRKYLTTAGDR